MAENKDFALKKNAPGCTGMFWRGGTSGNVVMAGDWPRDGSVLRGEVVEDNNQKWLRCTHIKQAGTNEFKPVESENSWMPFKYQQYYLERVIEA